MAALPHGDRVTVGQALARRRAIHRHRAAVARQAAFADAAEAFRARAQRQVAAGHPELAAPYLDEAELFDSAASRAVGL